MNNKQRAFQAVVVAILAAATAFSSPLTPGQTMLASAQRQVAAQPAYSGSYNDLAAALLVCAEETQDPAYFNQADAALAHSFSLEPENFAGRRVQAALLLARHDFEKALRLATDLNRKMPDDLQVRASLTDVHLAIGDYQAALESAQWMLNLRPGNVPGLVRGARLREVFGDIHGALELAQSADTSIDPSAIAERADLLSQLAHLHLLNRDLSAAAQSAQSAVDLAPTWPKAARALIEVRLAQKQFKDALRLAKEEYAAVPSTAHLYQLASTARMSGNEAAARTWFSQFEGEALLKVDLAYNDNLLLIRYYADLPAHHQQALTLAKRERALRHDLETLDCYALALAANGRYNEANTEIQAALKWGSQEPRFLVDSGRIALHLGRKAAAENYFRQASISQK